MSNHTEEHWHRRALEHRSTLFAVLTVVGISIFLGTACFEEDSCDRYVEYMCDCHDGEEGYDCDELQRIYADADPSLQDQCVTDLDTQMDEDEANGVSCSFDSE